MSATLGATGLKPINHPSGVIRPKRLQNGILSGYTSNLYQGVAILINTSGQINISAGGDDIVGAFWGVEFTLAGRRMPLPYWPASTVFDTTEPVYVYYFDDPNIVYEIQCDGSLAATSIGDQADFSNITAGAYPPGISGMTLSSTLKGVGAQGQFRIEALSPDVDNAWGDTYTKVQGKIARHQYVSNKVAV